MMRPLTASRFQEEMLTIMDRKHHWAWPAFSEGTATVDQMKRHFQQEYGVYVRDFPVLLARVHGRNPPPSVRRMLAENIYDCLLYTSDAADERSSVDLGGRRIIKKK